MVTAVSALHAGRPLGCDTARRDQPGPAAVRAGSRRLHGDRVSGRLTALGEARGGRGHGVLGQYLRARRTGIFLSEAQHVEGERALDAVLLASALVWAASCWRWGSPLFAGLSAVSSFLFPSRLPLGRALWLLAGAVLIGLVARRADDLAWAPSHRRAAMVLLVVGVAAVYVASNVYSLDEHVVEGFLKFAPPRGAQPAWLMVVAAIATAVLPLAVLCVGAEIATDRAARHGDRASRRCRSSRSGTTCTSRRSGWC